MSKRGRKSSKGCQVVIEVGATRIEVKGRRVGDRLLMELLGVAAGLALSAEPEDAEAADDSRPFGFAPVTANTELAEPVHDPRFDYVWEE